MVVICKEDVFDWFKKLSGGKRIELMCGLLNLCIPLEWRFFATFLERAAKRDYNLLKEAEAKSNSPEEFEKLTQMDWLAADIGPQPEEEVMNGGGGLAGSGAGNSLLSPSSSPDNDSNSMDKHLSSVRSKIVVYLCLLSSSNRVCATLAYKAFRNQLCLENISRHLFGSAVDSTNNGYTNNKTGCSPTLNATSGKPGNPKEPASFHHHSLSSSSSSDSGYPHLILDNKFYSEIVLLHTLAIHHPAFTFDQQTLLSEQLQKVQQWMDAVMFATAATASASANSLSSTTSTSNPLSVPPLGDLNQPQLVNLTCKLSLNSNINDRLGGGNFISLANNPHPESVPLIELPGQQKGPSPTPIAVTSCQSCPYTCTCSFSNSNSLATTPSITPPPPTTTVASSQHPINHATVAGPVQTPIAQSAPTTLTSPMHPYWFYFPPPPIPPQGPVINSYTSSAQATEQLFQYYYAVAMAAASTFGNSASTTPYWPPFQPPNGPLTTSPFTGMPTPITTGVNSLVAAAATFQTAKSTRVSCYNCGAYGHYGNECKQTNFDEQLSN